MYMSNIQLADWELAISITLNADKIIKLFCQVGEIV